MRASRGLKWEHKMYKRKRSIVHRPKRHSPCKMVSLAQKLKLSKIYQKRP